jgi:hypothetical protein
MISKDIAAEYCITAKDDITAEDIITTGDDYRRGHHRGRFHDQKGTTET